MITENLSTLKIHKLSQAQYDRELASGNIDENALYLTPDENHTHDDLYSLGAKTASSSTNMNSYTTAGQYEFSYAQWSSATNKPATAASGGVLIVETMLGVTAQTYRCLTGAEFRRYLKADYSWTEWQTVLLGVLTSDCYGTSLPSAGVAGRIFFKKASV